MAHLGLRGPNPGSEDAYLGALQSAYMSYFVYHQANTSSFEGANKKGKGKLSSIRVVA